MIISSTDTSSGELSPCPFRTRYSYALSKTKDAFGRSFNLKELVLFQVPSLSLYLRSSWIVLNSTDSPFCLLVPLFFQIVAVMAPVLNFFSGWLAIDITYCFSHFISNFPEVSRLLHRSRKLGRLFSKQP